MRRNAERRWFTPTPWTHTLRYMLIYLFLIAVLNDGHAGCSEGGKKGMYSFMVGATGWYPDMAVPPTPTPIKSGWWRRGRSQDDEDGSSSPGFRAPSSPDSRDHDVGEGGGAGQRGGGLFGGDDGGAALAQTSMRLGGTSLRHATCVGDVDSGENEHMQYESPAKGRRGEVRQIVCVYTRHQRN